MGINQPDKKEEPQGGTHGSHKSNDENFEEFTFENASNFIETNFQNDNYKYFQSHYHDIVKEMG